MWGSTPNYAELLGLAARGATRDDSPLPAGATGLPLPRLPRAIGRLDFGAWREMTGEGGSARAPKKPWPSLRRVLERDAGTAPFSRRCCPRDATRIKNLPLCLG